MGVKSTVTLTRREAEDRFVELAVTNDDPRRHFKALAALMDNTELEDALEHANDEANGGEGFENYIIEAKE